MNCPECCTSMQVESTDSRQEWCRIIYYCEKCDKVHSLLTTFKQQSSLVESEEWENEQETDFNKGKRK